MTQRTRKAQFWTHAPIAWVGNELVELDADETIEITASVPIYYERAVNNIERAPVVYLRMAHEPVDPTTPVVVGYDDGALVPTPLPALYSRPVVAGFEQIQIPIRPRELSTSTTLLDGRRIYLINQDAGNAIDAWIAFGVPLAGWE